MNFCQPLVKIGDDENFYKQEDSRTPVLYVCPMCEHKTNSVDDLKQHLTKTHVEPQSETEKSKNKKQNDIFEKEKQFETFKNEDSILMNEHLEIEVKKELMENHGNFLQDLPFLEATNINRESTEIEATSQVFHTIKLEDWNNLNSSDQNLFIKVEDPLQAEFYICKDELQNESDVNGFIHTNDDLNIIDVMRLKQNEAQPKVNFQDGDIKEKSIYCNRSCAQSCNLKLILEQVQERNLSNVYIVQSLLVIQVISNFISEHIQEISLSNVHNVQSLLLGQVALIITS
jgi:hypothetical protein